PSEIELGAQEKQSRWVDQGGWLIIPRRLGACEERLAKFHDAYATSLARSNFLVTTVDGVVELVEALGFVAILAPLARSCQEAVLAFERPNDDPHSVSDPWSFLLRSGVTANAGQRQSSALFGI